MPLARAPAAPATATKHQHTGVDCLAATLQLASSRSCSSSCRTVLRDPYERSIWLAGRGRTYCGHQNQRPSSAVMDGQVVKLHGFSKEGSPMRSNAAASYVMRRFGCWLMTAREG
jgi:hypothetical protein